MLGLEVLVLDLYILWFQKFVLPLSIQSPDDLILVNNNTVLWEKRASLSLSQKTESTEHIDLS